MAENKMMTNLRWNKLQPYLKCFSLFSTILAGYSTGLKNPSLPGYIGCYKDKADRAMKSYGNPWEGMTLDVCRERCLNYTENTYMGTEYPFECYCGDSYDKYGPLPQTKCNSTCGGNTSQICGGDFTLSVHTVCPIGYYGQRCTERCHCLNEAVCPRKNGTCPAGSCATGWKGSSCSKDEDECLREPCTEANQKECINTPGSYDCTCDTGYKFLTYFKICVDINECERNNHTCETDDALGVCINTAGSYRCECNQGYRLTMKNTCEDKNECLTNNGGCDQDCINTEGSFHCSCRQGYLLNTDGHKCDDINECLNRNGGCSHTCTNAESSYTCECIAGFKLSSDLHRCQDVDECDNSSLHTCDIALGVCINTIGWYECACKKGYQLRYSKLKNPDPINICEDIDECADAACGWNNNCTNTVGSYICHCEEEYYLSRDLTTCLATSDLIYGNNLWRIFVSVACMLGIIVIAILAYHLIGWYRKRNAIISGSQEPHEKNFAVRNYEIVMVEDKLEQDVTPIYEIYEKKIVALQEPLYDSCDYVPGNGQYHEPSVEDQDTQTQYEQLSDMNKVDYEQLHGAGRKENRKQNIRETKNYQPLIKTSQC